MTKYILLFITLFAGADEIQLAHATKEPYADVIKTNAKITQLSNQQQQIVSSLAGHIEKYFVKAGESVKKGDKVALIKSLAFSKMKEEYLSLQSQEKAASYEVNAAYKLYKKGINSKSDYNKKLIALQEIQSKRNTLKSQLTLLGMTSQDSDLILYAHADGVVGKLLVPLHSSVDAQTALMTLVNQSGYYALAYLSPKESQALDSKVKGWVDVWGKKYPCSFVQLLPQIDEETQRAKVLFWIEGNPKKLLLNAFVPLEIQLASKKEAIMIDKDALTLFNGEWVVFVPSEEEHTKHDADDNHETDAHDADEKEESHGHEDHEEDTPYLPKVVDILTSNGDKVAIKGLDAGEEYVSAGVYFVKSMLLKSALGEHGH